MVIGKIIIAAILIGISILGALNVFQFKTPEAQVSPEGSSDINVTEEPSQPFQFEWPTLNPKGIIDWIVNGLGQIGDFISNTISGLLIGKISSIFPKANPNLGWIILLIILSILGWWKVESLTSFLRTIMLIIIPILVGILILMLMGIV